MSNESITDLKAQLDDLTRRIAILEMNGKGEEDAAAIPDDAGANEAQVIPQQKLHAFDVVCDGRETDPWLVYLPSGCIAYAGFEPKVVDPAPDATTHLADLKSDTKNGEIYAHLHLEVDENSDSDSSSEPEVTGFPLLSIDTTPTQQPSGENIKVVNIKLAAITDGAVSQNVIGSLMLQARSGSGTVIVGDKDGSEFLKTDGKTIYIQGYPGESPSLSHSGIEFWTVSARTEEGGAKIPPKIIARIKGKPETESWQSHTLTVTHNDGNQEDIHFLGSHDIKFSEGEKNIDVVGGDYIEVEQKTDEQGNTYHEVEAKIETKDDYSETEHALLTSDTEQLVRAVKTFLGSLTPSASKRVIIDGPNGKVSVVNADGSKKIDLDSEDIPVECGGTLKIHELKFKDKDGNIQKYHGLFCDDIDLTKEGKMIKSTTVTASAALNGMNTIKFIYTDGTYDEFKVMNGINGSPGSPGKNGNTPEITAERQGNHVYIYADGDLIATIEDGKNPQITAQRTGTKQTTIYADGIAIAVINDGEDGQRGEEELTEMEMVTGVTFELSGNTLNAKVTKKKVKAVFVENVTEQTVNVADIGELDVVVSESYNDGSDYKFKNVRKRINVIGTPSNAQGQDVFTTTPLSGE